MDALWITEADVVGMMGLADALPALEQGLLAEARAEAHNMVKTHLGWGANNLHALGASFPEAGLVGTKTWAHTEGGTCPLLVLFDASTGELRAIIEAFALGQMRTAGISGVATDWLARPEADDMAIIGTGKQALAQVGAVAAVRRLARLRVYSPTRAKRYAFGEKVRNAFPFTVDVCDSVEATVADASIVTLVTRATRPFVTAAMLAKGAHVNAVGAITPERAELAPDVLARCTTIVVDSLPSTRKLSSELIGHFGDSDSGWDLVRPLSRVVADGRRRDATSDLTLFKAMGMGISDVALGRALLAKAVQTEVGRPIAQPVKCAIRLHG